MDEAASAARAAALERAGAEAREGARRLPAILAQQAKAARNRLRLAEAIIMSMAAASYKAEYDAWNKLTGGSCTTDAPASYKAESLADIKGKHGLQTAEEVCLYTPSTPSASSTGAADDKAGPETKLWRSGVPQLEGAWPLSSGPHAPGGLPKISRSGPARE